VPLLATHVRVRPIMADSDAVVIVGGGHAAVQLCAGLAAAGQGKRVHLVCAEPVLPYQRPPLSKTYLKDSSEALQIQRGEAWFAEAGITLHRADPAIALDRDLNVVRLQSGRNLEYARCVLATGAHPRRLPHLPDGLDNVALLRSAADAERLRSLLHAARHVTVLGGGFIGCEIAATARVLGKRVAVLEAAPRLLLRSVAPELAEHVLNTHRASGIDIRLGVAAGGFEFKGNRLSALAVDGKREPVELMVLGIGSVPEMTLAREAGLHCENGIVVDAYMRTSDTNVLAIGDCVSFPDPAGGRHIRLESVQNANDQARTALATLAGREEPYRATFWFWSDQGALRLQMTGLAPHESSRCRRDGATATSFSILHYVGERFVCVESVNAPLDHMAARKLLEAGKSPPPSLACDPAKALRTFL
jgi:3-phenylpropionate/trans-cinnamate dioxygenase ferredoxin reductase subunit